jgi:short-subunit dehydrogenase
MPSAKNVVITGASQGIGKAITEEYASSGHNLVLLSRNVDAIKQLSEYINSKGGKCFCKRCDVSDYNSVEEGIEFAHTSLGTIDIAVLNAGIGSPEWISSFRSKEFKKVFETNTFGIAYCLEFLIPIMKAQSYGKIAGVTSLGDVRGYAGSSSYSASKSAASILLESARVELKSLNITVITIRPGFVKTAMTDKNEFKMPFLMSTEKAAKIIVKGIAQNKSIVQFPFLTVNATRIIKNLPNWFYDWLMVKVRPVKD